MQVESGSGPTTAELIVRCQGLVRSIAWKIHQKLPRNIELDDLIGYGQIGLAKAARDYDENRGNQFTTYAYYRVRGAILDGLSNLGWFSKIDYARGVYQQAAESVLCSDSTVDDVETDVEWFAKTAQSLCTAFLISDLSSGQQPAIDACGSPDQIVEADELRERIRHVIALLPDQERSLINSIYFDGLSIKDAGEKLGFEKSWASRLHASVLGSLGRQLTSTRV